LADRTVVGAGSSEAGVAALTVDGASVGAQFGRGLLERGAIDEVVYPLVAGNGGVLGGLSDGSRAGSRFRRRRGKRRGSRERRWRRRRHRRGGRRGRPGIGFQVLGRLLLGPGQFERREFGYRRLGAGQFDGWRARN